MRLHAKQGVTMAEYGILLAIVLGAAIAMQQYVKSRLQGGIAGVADGYTTAASAAGGYGAFNPNVTTDSMSTSNASMQMTTATAGTVQTSSGGNTTQVQTK
jgi:Flp pilus assembly pilin Flp